MSEIILLFLQKRNKIIKLILFMNKIGFFCYLRKIHLSFRFYYDKRLINLC
ncbi:hypothetical protein D925_01974 [Enterococcus faecalis B83616-1]|nr:hypothetical protein D925_01974 [Enterococcus faecalis B83616-1]